MGQELTVIVPVYNEGPTIGDVMDRLLSLSIVSQLVVVDDGSTDSTLSELSSRRDDPRVLVLSHPSNRGKGCAIRTALALVSTEYVIVQDADAEYDPAEIERLLDGLRSGASDVVYGSRYMLTSRRHLGRIVFELGISILNLMCAVLYGLRLTDEATCYKLFRTDDLRRMRLQSKRFEFCAEVTAKASRLGLRIREMPISYSPRTGRDGKKLRLSDGFVAMLTLIRYRFWMPKPPIGSCEKALSKCVPN